MATSPYTRSLGEKYIRIAKLEAGRPDDPVKCRLVRTKLNRFLDFQALSYEWKSELGHTEVFCNNTALEVTRNLVDALKSLRHHDKHRYLWVDAICINQGDEKEKSMQVRLMPEIYASAKSVLVWLGLSVEGLAEAFKIFPYLARVAVERHPTGKPDTLTVDDLLGCYIDERPAHGSILRSKEAGFYIRHDRDVMYMNVVPQCAELSDDEIFRFGDHQVWKAVDTLFNSSYFYRSWILQEIAVAEGIYVQCGTHVVDWDIFHVAYEGRSLLRFKSTNEKSNLLCVRDVRRRYRSRGISNFHCFDLVQVLTSFTYSRETDPRDRIYAALGIVFPSEICHDIVPDYSKSSADVFYDAARHIILSRNDLYLWSSKTLKSTRSISEMPTWVPEWTMPPCEEALEFASPEFSGCLPGNYRIEGKDLFVDGYLLDEVCKVFHLDGFTETIDLITGLREWLGSRQSSLFSDYPIPCPDSTHVSSDRLRLQNALTESKTLLADYSDLPRHAIELLHGMKETNDAYGEIKNGVLNIESMWLVLTSAWYHRHKSTRKCGHHLLLSMLYWHSLCVSKQRPGFIGEQIPKRYSKWVCLAVLLLNSTKPLKLSFDTLLHQTKMENTPGYIDDCFFVTQKGFFGRAPATVVKPGLFIAILGGAWTPYLLEQHEDHFELISHTYVEGIMSMSRLGRGFHVQRLKLK